MRELVVLDVFLGPGPTGGNRLGVIVGDDTAPGARQRRAAELGYSETGRPDWVDEAAGVVRARAFPRRG
jgi:predicted PhzF superfamily epimerase YddE/YHI9